MELQPSVGCSSGAAIIAILTVFTSVHQNWTSGWKLMKTDMLFPIVQKMLFSSRILKMSRRSVLS